MIDDLTVPCAFTPNSVLVTHAEPTVPVLTMTITEVSEVFPGGQDTASVMLDPAAARAIFNHLGIWLHKCGETTT